MKRWKFALTEGKFCHFQIGILIKQEKMRHNSSTLRPQSGGFEDSEAVEAGCVAVSLEVLCLLFMW